MPGGPLLEIVFKDQQIESYLSLLLARLGDLRPVLREIGEHMVASTKHNFKSETAPDGKKWAPLNTKYLAAKQRRGLSEMILQSSGRLMNSIHPVVQATEVLVGTNVRSKTGFPYPLVMQLGTTKAGRNHNVTIPKREFLGFSPKDRDAILDIAIGYMAS